jgi:hypothetical protein
MARDMIIKNMFALLASSYVSFGVSTMATGGLVESDLLTICLFFSVIFVPSWSILSFFLFPDNKEILTRYRHYLRRSSV